MRPSFYLIGKFVAYKNHTALTIKCLIHFVGKFSITRNTCLDCKIDCFFRGGNVLYAYSTPHHIHLPHIYYLLVVVYSAVYIHLYTIYEYSNNFSLIHSHPRRISFADIRMVRMMGRYGELVWDWWWSISNRLPLLVVSRCVFCILYSNCYMDSMAVAYTCTIYNTARCKKTKPKYYI